MSTTTKRTIAIIHRIKQSAAGEARPTLVRIAPLEGSIQDIKLNDEQAELDFILGRHPLRYRNATAEDKLTDFPDHQLKMTEYDAEKHGIVPEHHKKVISRKTFVLTEVPDVLVGLQKDDMVLMSLGGSGDYFAFAMSVQAEKIGATVLRIPPRFIKMERDRVHAVADVEKCDDLELLSQLQKSHPELFYPVTVHARDMIRARELLRAREYVQKDRKSCAMRVRQLTVGGIFVRPDGLFPQGSIQMEFDEREANDDILNLIEKREKQLEKQLGIALERIPVYQNVFSPIEGVGPVIAAGIICPVGDVRLFVRSGGNLRYRAGKLKRFCGFGIVDGKLPRKTSGQSLGFNPQVRQALVKFGVQMIKRPGSEWGKRLALNKEYYKTKYPFETLNVREGEYAGEYLVNDVVCRKKGTGHEIKIGEGWEKVVGKRKNFKGHLHKKAVWRTLTEFVEHLYDEWSRLEGIIPGAGEEDEKAKAA
jgi:hypothetical protein